MLVTSVWNLIFQMVSQTDWIMICRLNRRFSAEVACNLFVALTSADQYKSMLSHLGPDKKVR